MTRVGVHFLCITLYQYKIMFQRPAVPIKYGTLAQKKCKIMRYVKGDDHLNAQSVTKSVGKKLKKLHLDLPRKYKNKQVLDLKIIIYYVYQIQWVIRVGKKYLPQPCKTVRSCKIMYTQKTHAYHSCKSKVTNNICQYRPQMRVNLR